MTRSSLPAETGHLWGSAAIAIIRPVLASRVPLPSKSASSPGDPSAHLTQLVEGDVERDLSPIATQVRHLRNAVQHWDHARLSDRGLLEGWLGEVASLMDGLDAPEAAADARRLRSTFGWLEALPVEFGDPRDVLLVAPCSAHKTFGGGPEESSHFTGVAARVAPDVAERLADARRRRAAPGLVFLGDGLRPAFERYDGTLWADTGLRDQVRARQLVGEPLHLLLVSGAYGAVTWDEPIDRYDAAFELEDWAELVLEEVIASYCEQNGIRRVIWFGSSSRAEDDPYGRLARRMPWDAAAVDEVCLVTAHDIVTCQRPNTDRPQGEAMRTLLTSGAIPRGWIPSTGHALRVQRLKTWEDPNRRGR